MQPELDLEIKKREVAEKAKAVTRRVMADMKLAGMGDDVPYVIRVVRHLCGSRIAFTPGIVADFAEVELAYAQFHVDEAWGWGWCNRAENRDGPPHPLRGTHFYVGRL